MYTVATPKTDFATHLFNQLVAEAPGKNLFLSPFSIRVALAMCSVGAKGETRKVLADLIDAPTSVDEQNKRYGELLKSVNGDGQRAFELVTANALWGQQGFHFKSDFKRAVADYYDGAFNEVNFVDSPDNAVQTINAWVSEKTRAKIKELVARELIDKDTRLILTNAIYFKGSWENQFDKATTFEENWHGPTGTNKVPMMHQSGGFLYYEGDGFQALDLPYKGKQLSLLVALPTSKDGLTSLETGWAAGGIFETVTAALKHEARVVVSLPRFTLEAEFKLKPVLCDLGAELAFTDSADFSGIGDDPLKIAEVVHRAFVEVNEEGTEAAAATAVLVMRAAGIMRMPTPKIFKADHPFLFFIRDSLTNTVLFSGRLIEPK